jgi:hypothetical protein
MQGEISVGGTQAGDEVIFESPDGAFGGVVTVHAGGHKLKIDVLFRHVSLEDGGGFIVELLKLGT